MPYVDGDRLRQRLESGPLATGEVVSVLRDVARALAIVYFERFLTTPDPQPEQNSRWRAEVHRRLGELYEAKGAKRQAAEQYRRLVDLWVRADANLQPQVAEVRQRLGQLGG
jgi:hypothetical protein